MTDPVRQPPAPAPTASASEFVVTFAVILALIVVLLAADTSLARIDRRESSAHAASLYAEGQALLANGQPHAAVDRFVAAFAAERSNVRYQLALGEALLGDGRLEEAEVTLNAVLAREQMDGAANIAMARVLMKAKRIDEAKSFYHRAIYGRWGADSAHARIVTRLELIDLLVARGSKRELLAELLPLEETMPDSLLLRRRIGHLFVVAGSPARGARLFRDLLQRDPSDGDAYSGMAEAALSLGNFRTARADLLQASRLLPQDAAIASRLALADTILAIDPLERGLSPHERFVRARALVARILAQGSSCAALSGARAQRFAAARDALGSDLRQQREETTEQLLALASDLYADLSAQCADTHDASGEALQLIHAHLPQ